MDIPDRISRFIGEHHIMTLAVTRDDRPWCATCFYAYLPDENRFVYTSDPDTRHVRDVIDGGNFHVAGTIALETKIVGRIRGIQLTGVIIPLTEPDDKIYKAAYLKRFPIARLAPALHLWLLEPDYFKMTDNRLGFGKKLIWQTSGITK